MEKTSQPMGERLIGIDDEMINPGPLQLPSDALLIEPDATTTGHKRAARFGFTSQQDARSCQSPFRQIAELQCHAVVLLRQKP